MSAFDSPVVSQQNMALQGATSTNPVIQFVYKKYIESKTYRRQFDQPWEKWYRRYSGYHWDSPRPSWRSSPTVNFTFSTIETIIPIMTDQSPKITVVAKRPENAAITEVFGNVVDRIWFDNDMDIKLPMIVKNSLKYGTGIAKVFWDPTRGPDGPDGSKLGDVGISAVDPRHFFISPGATSIEDADYCIFAANLPVPTVQRMFPNAPPIEGGIWGEDLSIQKTMIGTEAPSLPMIGPIQTTDGSQASWPIQGYPNAPSMDRKGLVTLVECWYKDDDGKVNCVIVANGTILKGPVQPFRIQMYPFVRFVDYQIPSVFWGMGEIQQLESLQESINRRRGQIIDILRLTANPPLVADSDAGINPKALTNRPGIILFKNRGSDIRWLTPPQLPAALFELQNLDKQDFDSISGVFDVTQGRRPVGIEAASAISELQEAAQTRIRLKVRNMESSLRQMGKLVIALVQQFYDEPRTIRINGIAGQPQQFVQVNQDVQDEMGAIQRINDLSVGDFDVEIGVGSTMPVNKSRRFNQLVQLYQLQIVDAQAVLENSGLSMPEVSRIMNRMQQQQQQMQMLQQQMGQQGGGPPGGAPVKRGPAKLPDEAELKKHEASVGIGAKNAQNQPQQ